MGLFKTKRREEVKTEKSIETRLDVLETEKELLKEFSEEFSNDMKKLMIEEDMIDEDTIKAIPYIKKYGKMFENLTELSYESAEIEIRHAETIEKAICELELDMEGIKKELESTNKILDKIAKVLEKK